MKCHPGLVQTAEGIREIVEHLKGKDMVAFDTEFIRETTFFPMVEILQVASDEESWLIDAKVFRRKDPVQTGIQPLLDVFRDQKILKVIHAAQGDQECLYTSFGLTASPSIDTAAAASLCGFGESVGLANLLKSVMDVSLKKGHARTDWTVRPLPEQLEEYAHADVVHLVELARQLLDRLDQSGRRQWGLELSAKWEDPKLYESNPEEMAQKLVRGGRLDKRGYAALLELVKWREDRVRQLNLPRRWVADDSVLVDLAHVRPKDMQHLSAFRGLNKGELKNSGEAILAALEKATHAEDVKLPRFPKPDIPSEAEGQALELMKCFVGMLADQHRIAAKHLLTAHQLLPVLRSGAISADELSTKGLVSHGASQIIGDELVAFIQGRRALSVNGRSVRVVEVPA
jgi:ribonuclease D